MLGIASLSLAAVLVPAHALAAVASVGSLVVDPTEGLPGASVSGTVTIDPASCTVSSVSISGAYVDTKGKDATVDPVPAAQQGTSSTYRATLVLPSDAASTDVSDSSVTYSATAVCADAAATPSPAPRPAGSTHLAGTASVKVLTFAAPVVTVDPDTVEVGKSFAFSVTGCLGGLADFFFLDGDGNDATVPDTAGSATSFHGSYTVAQTAATGDGGIVVDCAQTAQGAAGVRITHLAAEGKAGGAPVAVPVISRPHFTG